MGARSLIKLFERLQARAAAESPPRSAAQSLLSPIAVTTAESASGNDQEENDVDMEPVEVSACARRLACCLLTSSHRRQQQQQQQPEEGKGEEEMEDKDEEQKEEEQKEEAEPELAEEEVEPEPAGTAN